MKIAIIGYGVEGRAAYEYWQAGNDLTICDKNQQLQVPDGVTTKLGDDYLHNLEQFDLIVRASPFVRPDAIVAANSDAIIPKITSSTNEFMRVCPTRNIIGITGTKGKGTTSTLTAGMLRAAGKTVHLGGNIGIAAIDLLKEDIQPEDWVILELSSFQLIDIKQSPRIAACLMVVSEHMDFHIDFQEYLTAKQQLFKWQAPQDVAIYYAGNDTSKLIASAGLGQKIPFTEMPGAYIANGQIVMYGNTICSTDDIKLLGKHNWQNVCAAVTIVWQITQDVTAMRGIITTFTGLEHRLEFVREHAGVRYYDDSFGTTPETAIVAIEAFQEPKVIILGGSDKGASYDELATAVKAANMRQVLLIGDQAARIQSALDRVGFSNYMPGGDTMADIVTNVQAASQAGDVALLSTGCASFGMFKDYKDRGNQFKTSVQALA